MTARFKHRLLVVLGFAIVLVPMLVAAVRTWHALPPTPGIAIGTADPDPWLRLTLVRDWLTGGDWYSHAVARSDAPWGRTVSPWTRPLDLVIGFFTAVQPHTVDLSLRLVRAALLMPLLWMVLLLAGMARALRMLQASPESVLAVCVLVALSFGMRNYFGVANADHHAMLAAVFVWAMGGVFASVPSRRLVMGSAALFALQLWISPEALVLIAMVYGWYGLQWLRGDASRTLPWLATGIAAASAVAVMVERAPAQWLVPVYDSISVVYVFTLALAAGLAWGLYWLRPSRPVARACVAAAGFALALAAVWRVYPLMLRGPLVEADPYIFSHFLPHISEVRPLWKEPLLRVLAMLVQPVAIGLILMGAWRAERSIFSRMQVLQLGYFTALTLALYLSQQRFYYYFYPVAMLTLAPFLTAVMAPVRGVWPGNWLAELSPNAQTVRRLPLLLAMLGLPLLLLYLAPDRRDIHAIRNDDCDVTARQLMYDGTIDRLGGGAPLILFAPTNLSGEILFWTHQRIIAGNYHREGAGIRYVWEADAVTDAAELRRYFGERKVAALLLCPARKLIAGSVLQGLQEGVTPPSWLAPVPYTLPMRDAKNPYVEGAKPALFLVRPLAK